MNGENYYQKELCTEVPYNKEELSRKDDWSNKKNELWSTKMNSKQSFCILH